MVEGVPFFDLWILVAIIVAFAIWLYFRTTVQGVPVLILWVYRNGSAIFLKADEDLQGVFLKIRNLSGRGKVIETVKKTAQPLETIDVSHLKDSKYYILPSGQKDEKGLEVHKIYLQVSYSKMKHARLYAVGEGTGQTIDIINKLEAIRDKTDTGNAVVLHEERGAAKELFKDFAVALAGTFRALILPMLAGGGLAGAGIMLILVLTGHFR